MSRAPGKGKKESAVERRQRKALNKSAHQSAVYIWAGFFGVLTVVLLVVYWVASRPKDAVAEILNQAAATAALAGTAEQAAEPLLIDPMI